MRTCESVCVHVACVHVACVHVACDRIPDIIAAVGMRTRAEPGTRGGGGGSTAEDTNELPGADKTNNK